LLAVTNDDLSDEPEIGSSSRPLNYPSIGLSWSTRRTRESHRSCPSVGSADSLSRIVLEVETLGVAADARPPLWRRLPRGRTHRKPSRALMTPLPPPV